MRELRTASGRAVGATSLHPTEQHEQHIRVGPRHAEQGAETQAETRTGELIPGQSKEPGADTRQSRELFPGQRPEAGSRNPGRDQEHGADARAETESRKLIPRQSRELIPGQRLGAGT